MMGHASATVRQFTVTLTLPQGLQSTYITVLKHINYSELQPHAWKKHTWSADYRYNGLSLHLGTILKEESEKKVGLFLHVMTDIKRALGTLSLVVMRHPCHARFTGL